MTIEAKSLSFQRIIEAMGFHIDQFPCNPSEGKHAMMEVVFRGEPTMLGPDGKELGYIGKHRDSTWDR